MYAVIFDMDGVLVDSHDLIWKSHNEVLGKQGIHLTEQDIKRYLGKSLRDDVEDWKTRYGYNSDLETHTKASWEIQVKLLEQMKADKGLIALLEELKAKGIPLGVGTSSQRFKAEKILELLGIEKYFPVLVTANDVHLHKPNPDLFLEVARRLEIHPRNCVVIEDAGNGIEAAKRAGMITVGYINGKNGYEEVKEADKVIKDFSELSHKTLQGLFKK
jgi:HAD superfamily hydrolase (TIGR01509 family)